MCAAGNLDRDVFTVSTMTTYGELPHRRYGS